MSYNYFRRKFTTEKQNSVDGKENVEIYSKKMNGPLSFTDSIQKHSNEDVAYQIDDTEDSNENNQADQDEKLNKPQDTNEPINIEVQEEEETINAPSDEKRSSDLMERMKRSLGVAAEEEVRLNKNNFDYYIL